MERGYVDIVYGQLQFTFRFSLLSLLQNGTRGGCSLAYETALPHWHLPLAEYDQWTHGQKIAFGKVMISHTPKHLLGMRGLWFIPHAAYTQSQTEKQLCGMVSFLYGVEEAKRCRGETNLTVDYYRQPAMLVEKAELCAMEQGFDKGLCNADFRYLVNEFYPDHAVFVYDYRWQPMFVHKGPLYVDVGRQPFVNGDLTLSVIEQSFQYRINIFLDLEKQHFIPIFNIRLFFFPLSPRKQDMRQIATDLNNLLHHPEKSTQQSKPLMRSSAVRFPCPHCHLRTGPDFSLHRCEVDRCVFCERIFLSRKGYELHMKKSGVWECERCQSQIPNQQCYRAHQVLCSGKCYDRCVYCKKYYPMHKRHVCPSYKCDRCGYYGTDPLEYEDGSLDKPFRRLHECPLKGKGSWKKKHRAGSVKTYAFDFESMLETCEHATLRTVTPDGERQAVPVYRHRVNYAFALALGEEMSMVEAWTIEDFWKEILKVSLVESTHWYAHNLKGYDGRLLLDYLESVDISPSSLLQRGDKILSMVIPHPENNGDTKITFKDSLLHIIFVSPLFSG